MSEAPAPSEGPLTFAQAVASITTPEPEEQAQEAPAQAAEGDEAEGAASAPEEAEGEAAEPAEAEETEAEAEAVEPVEPPKYWSQDAKAKFAELPPELQAVVLQQEGPREEAAAKAKAEAATVKQQAQAELGKVQQLADSLSGFLPQAIEAFQSRWGSDPDWIAYANEYGAEAMTLAKVQHDRDLALLQQTAQATQRAQAEAREASVKAEFATLAEIAPDLTDPAEGGKRRTEITTYLINEGLEPEAIRDISAKEMVLARKAMLWDRSQALKAAPSKKPAAPPPKLTAKPSAPGAQPHPTKQARGRFDQKPSIDNAVALLLAKG